jgi:hypothetical protein
MFVEGLKASNTAATDTENTESGQGNNEDIGPAFEEQPILPWSQAMFSIYSVSNVIICLFLLILICYSVAYAYSLRCQGFKRYQEILYT